MILVLLLISQLNDLSSNGYDFAIQGSVTWNDDVPISIEPVYGCTDEFAQNYDSEATADDGSCDLGVYPDNGDHLISFDEQGDHVVFSDNGLGSGNGNYSLFFLK